jgi:hypothetical protein
MKVTSEYLSEVQEFTTRELLGKGAGGSLGAVEELQGQVDLLLDVVAKLLDASTLTLDEILEVTGNSYYQAVEK